MPRVSPRHRRTRSRWPSTNSKTGRVIVCADGGTVWEYDSDENTWTRCSFTHDAPLGGGNSVVYEPTTARVILFGGMATDGETSWYCNDTWAYSILVAGTWTNPRSPRGSPGDMPCWDAFMAYDPGSGKIILTGGVNREGREPGRHVGLRPGRQHVDRVDTVRRRASLKYRRIAPSTIPIPTRSSTSGQEWSTPTTSPPAYGPSASPWASVPE